MPQPGWTILVSALALAAGGCSQIDLRSPFGLQPPPTVADTRAAYASNAPKRTVVVVGSFDDPAHSVVDWTNIGADLADALERTLLNDQRFDIRASDSLASSVAHALHRSDGKERASLSAVRRQYPDVDFVIVGRVTDFNHTGEMAGEVVRHNLLSAKNEAIAAVDITVVDLRGERIAVADHVHGIARAGDKPAAETYSGLTFNSYVFWSTPLGKASNELIDKTIQRLSALLPSHVAEVQITQVQGWREVTLSGGRDHGIEPGQRYYVCIRDAATGELRAVNDEVLMSPLKAQITKAERRRATAWLMGEPPASVNLTNGVLTWELPKKERLAGATD